ncbi:Cytochrome P450 monooxygenase rdc4 [Lasiodiplodia hormozganensis]|uniref:Cytochrome P450 monooxygenase rdc4 n=1 Tax=Lasiodiplodia hormozganensis TaxID=869390 RepID=A0AA40CM39_9PEZI|nr:Cytochrome P450 monooxygenase rdc4 [Lasiodiplodia hormozganensis]
MDFASQSHLLTPTNIPALLGGAVVTAIVYALGVAIYNVYFHPLSKYPGPKLYAASRIPYALDLSYGTINQAISDAHKKYGDVVRIAPNELSFISGDTAWNDIYGFRGAKKPEFGKDRDWYNKPVNGTYSMLGAGREDHSRMRRVFSHAFSDKALREQEPLIQRYIGMLMQRFGEKARAGVDVDLVRYYNFTTFDIIGDLTFGESFGCLETDDYHALVSGVFASLRAGNRRKALHYWPALQKAYFAWDSLTRQGKVQGNVIFHKFTAAKVDKRLATETDRPDIITAIEKQPETKALSRPEIQTNSELFLIAGSETTATMLSGTTMCLLKNPETMKKLVAEIRGAFKSSDEITFERVGQLPYLIAALTEGMRFYPPVPTGFPRKVPEGGDNVGGHYVPGDTAVYVSQYATYHSPQNFTDPESYIPERWIGDDPRFAKDRKSVLMPFSNGPRNCLGKNLAYAEMRTILAKTLFNYDLELLEDKTGNWFDQKVFALWEKGPLLVRVKEARR